MGAVDNRNGPSRSFGIRAESDLAGLKNESKRCPWFGASVLPRLFLHSDGALIVIELSRYSMAMGRALQANAIGGPVSW